MRLTLTSMAAAAATLAAGLAASPSFAQNEQRVEITGSSIKRIAAEGALPVITLNKGDIERSGATSVRELVQALPSMQGFSVPSDSINGGQGGTTTASLRNLGSIYTLVLLNGRRVAPFSSGSTVNLEQLPLSVIERVEVLADGASALYGADAIAGVVNFITKKNSSGGGIDLSASVPQKAGGKEWQASISKGFGDVDRDGFNLLAGLSVERIDAINASQRDFSKSGVIPFEHHGRKLYFWQLSPFSSPPNVTLENADGEELGVFSPGKLIRGNCGEDTAAFAQGDACRFDFSSTVQAQPSSERKNLFLSGQVRLGSEWTGFAEALLSDVAMTGRFAPPAQGLRMALDGALYQRHVLPLLGQLGIDPADVAFATLSMRVRDAGPRASRYGTKGTHLVAGVEGQLLGFDTSISAIHSKNKLNERYAGGYLSKLAFDRLIADNQFDPFVQGTGAASDRLAPAILDMTTSDSISQLDVLSLKGSRELFMLAGKPVYLGLGLDLTRQRYANTPSPMQMGRNALQPDFDDLPIGASQGGLPFDTARRSTGAFAELQLPLSKTFELSASLRHDAYAAAKNSSNFDTAGRPIAAAEQGNSYRKATYKVGLRFQPTAEWLLRASYGTGFRAPTLEDVADPLKDFGVLSVARPCPVAAGDPLYAGCRSTPTQYNLRIGGNPFSGAQGLRPETSKQWTVGLRFEPSAAMSMGAELWSVAIKDIIAVVPEDAAFDHFETYRQLFTVTTDTATARPILTLNQVRFNGASAKSSGVDLDLTARLAMPLGRLTTRLMATYLIESYFDFGFGGGKESSLGKMGSDDQVAFRTLIKLQGTLDSGPFSNTVTAQWKPGYRDQTYSADDGIVRERNADGTPGDFVAIDDFRVPAYWTLDWQGRWNISSDFSLQAGIKNLLNKKPPLSIKSVGGNMVGFDPRYADGRGRTFQLTAQYRF